MVTKRIRKPTESAMTLQQAKLHLRVDFDDDDELIQDLITTVREAAEDRLGRTLINTGWRLTCDAFTPVLTLLNPPCISVVSVNYIDPNGATCTFEPACYLLDDASEPARLVPAPGSAWPQTQQRVNAVWVDYNAGYGDAATDVPTPIVQWMKLAMTDLYDNRSRSADKPKLPQNFADGLLDTYRIFGL